jgi:hypothetical protein
VKKLAGAWARPLLPDQLSLFKTSSARRIPASAVEQRAILRQQLIVLNR